LRDRFHTAGHRVILFDIDKYWLSGYRFSNAVAGFTPFLTRKDVVLHDVLRAIAKQEKHRPFIPVGIFARSYFDSSASQC